MPIPRGWSEKKVGSVRCAKGSIRTKTLSAKKRLLICCRAGSWSPRLKRCTTGTRAFAMLTKKGN